MKHHASPGRLFLPVSATIRICRLAVMHLLYLDDSGSVKNASDRHIILAGVAVFERLPFWFSQQLDEIAAQIWPEGWERLEFRGSDMFAGRKRWRAVPREARQKFYLEALELLARSRRVRLFGAAIYKSAVSPDDPMEFAFEQLINRFDRYLGRLHKANDTQRGLIILDKSSYETSLQRLAREFGRMGHRWGRTYNIGEVPLFVDSRATRMIQFADLIAYALRAYYERGDATFFDKVAHLFDGEGGVLHGLIHYIPAGQECNCRACRQRAA